MNAIDRAALDALALQAVPRAAIIAAGYRSMVASSDLHPFGYQVRHWIRLRDGAELLEYHARFRSPGQLPRLTARDYEEQAAIHRALGLGVVGRGERWFDAKGQLYLFDLFAG